MNSSARILIFLLLTISFSAVGLTESTPFDTLFDSYIKSIIKIFNFLEIVGISLGVLVTAFGMFRLNSQNFFIGIVLIVLGFIFPKGIYLLLYLSDVDIADIKPEEPKGTSNWILFFAILVVFDIIALIKLASRKNKVDDVISELSQEVEQEQKQSNEKIKKVLNPKKKEKYPELEGLPKEIKEALILFKTDLLTPKEIKEKRYRKLLQKIKAIVNKTKKITVKFEEDRYELEQIEKAHIPQLIKRYLETKPEKRNFNELKQALKYIDNFIEYIAKNSFSDDSNFNAYKNFIEKKYKVTKM